ncbi:hypothetical protein PLICRDRAFT_42888 [Plicaturopsis crispa FD-325 SS-3]|nr:hypothetical protein PLICRDRAFT_42888 [Plicaturopsis crispa FD-325 SS-3]
MATGTGSKDSPSQRWSHFHAALQLAIQRAAHKWTYEDFSECFELWCKEQPDGANAVFNAVSAHMETEIAKRCDETAEAYAFRENIDILHAVVTEARERRRRAEHGSKDVWRETLQPREAIRARTVPLLISERDKLRAWLKELEEENRGLQAQVVANVRSREGVDAKADVLLGIIDDAYEKWKGVKLDDIESWTVATAETTRSRS